MNSRSKFVAAVLGLLLFGTPLFALANCGSKTAMAHCGGDDCPMMHLQQQPGTQVSGVPSGDGSCCRISTAPLSATQVALPNGVKVSLQQPTVHVVAMSPDRLVAPNEGPPGVSQVASPPLRTLLCSFLV